MATNLEAEGIFSDDPSATSTAVAQGPVPGAPTETTNLPSTDSRFPPSADLAAIRARTMARGIGPMINKSEDDIYGHLLSGDEDYMRKQAALQRDAEREVNKQLFIQQIANKTGGPLSQDDVKAVEAALDPFHPMNRPADPRAVAEQAYSQNTVSTLMGTATDFMKSSTIIPEAQQEDPNAVKGGLETATDLLTRNQIILTGAQDAQTAIDNQSYVGYGFDLARNFFQPYVEARLRNQFDTGWLTGLGLGSNLDEARRNLYNMPIPEMTEKYSQAMKTLSNNPQLQLQFAQAMLGQDSFETIANNAMTALTIPDYIGGAKLLAKGGKAIARQGQVRKAARDIVEAAAKDVTGNPVTPVEASGDLAEAAVQKVSKAVTDAINGQGNPLEMAHDTLLSTWYDWSKRAISNPGTYLGRELLTRTADGITRAGEDIYQKLATSSRAERIPSIIANPDSVRALQQAERMNYKGPANTLLDISEPIREPLSGTWWWKSTLGYYDGSLLPDVETTIAHGKNLGLANPIVKGEAPEKIYVPADSILQREFVNSKKKNFQGEGLGETKLKLNPNLEIRNLEEGIPTFHILPEDKPSKIKIDGRAIPNPERAEQISTTTSPRSGYIPFNLKTRKFEAQLTDETAKVEQQGLGFYLEKWTPVKEDGDIVRDLLIKDTKGDYLPDAISNATTDTKNIVKALLSWARTSDETLSINESAQRKAVTYAQNNIHKWAEGLAKDLEDIANGRIREDPVTGARLNRAMVYPKSWINRIKDREVAHQFQRTLDFGRREFDADGNPGKFFDTPADLQAFYNANWKRDPSYLETKAYFNFVKLIEGDRMMREVSEFRYRARLGTEQHQLSYIDDTGEKKLSGFFDGITQKHFPGGDEQILVLHANKPPQVLKLDRVSDPEKSAFSDSVKEGRAKIIMLYDRNQMPLNNFLPITKDQIIRYVMTDTSETKPIDFNHVKRRGGGHFEWDYNFFLKQADVRKQNVGKGLEYVYLGDTTVMPIKSGKLGQDVVKIWNEAHEHIKAGNWGAVKPLVQKLGIKYDEFTSWYHPGRDANGNPTRPLLNAHEPIVVVDRNKKISEMGSDLQNRYRLPRKNGDGYTELFRDATKSGPENNFKVQYNQERNSSINTRTINDVGSQGNPIYAHQPAEMVDPLTTMNRALNRVINSTYMDDYKIMSVEHWLREAAPYLNASEAELRSAPFAWFNKPEWRSAVKDSPAVTNLMMNRMKVNQFVGQPSKFDTWIHGLTSNMIDSAYENYGPEASRSLYQKAKTIVPIWMLQHVSDPVQFLRSVTYNFKLGLFAIPQFLVQAQTHSLIWAMEPQHGTVGTYAMMLHGWSSFTQDAKVLQTIDKYATKLSGFGSRFRPGEFLEARAELEKSGFANVAGEYGNINNQLKTRFIMNDWEKGLKLGQYPFRLGEQTTRLTAWYTAFREFREANPNVAIGNAERTKILSKADLLTVNMSRASNSGLSHGVFSLSTQFLSYQIKLAELFLGERLGATPWERTVKRASILGTFTALYGLPNAIGVTGLPIGEWMKEQFTDDLGYIPGEKWYSTMVNEGLPAWTMAMVTGKLDNVGDRFGSQGFENIKQALRGDIPFAVALGGAGVSTGWNFAKAFTDPYYQWINSWMRGDNKDPRFTLTASDLLAPLKEISSVSTGAKWWAAIQTGKWISKNEQNVTDVTPLHATLLALTGMSPQEQDTLFTQNKMIKGEEDAKKKALSGFIVDWRRGIQTRANDEDSSIRYFNNARARALISGMSPAEISTAIAIATRAAGKNAINDSDYNVWAKGDYNKRDSRIEQYRTKLKMKEQQ